ncbi:unnamed protein product [Closterium sp. Naga37s-1]|nr:unnamed protein product [Closterium sp. Naga37s-1]
MSLEIATEPLAARLTRCGHSRANAFPHPSEPLPLRPPVVVSAGVVIGTPDLHTSLILSFPLHPLSPPSSSLPPVLLSLPCHPLLLLSSSHPYHPLPPCPPLSPLFSSLSSVLLSPPCPPLSPLFSSLSSVLLSPPCPPLSPLSFPFFPLYWSLFSPSFPFIGHSFPLLPPFLVTPFPFFPLYQSLLSHSFPFIGHSFPPLHPSFRHRFPLLPLSSPLLHSPFHSFPVAFFMPCHCSATLHFSPRAQLSVGAGCSRAAGRHGGEDMGATLPHEP